MSAELPPLLNKRALRPFGWNEQLIAAILGKPDIVQAHKKGMRRWEEHLYTRERILEGMRDPRFFAHLAARRARAVAAQEREKSVTSRYASWRDALPQACAGMFSLNRYAKHRTCSELHKLEIYRLKNELIEALYRSGCCTAAWMHTLPPQVCRACGGSGDGDCGRCDGSGVYRRALPLWCFRFEVAGKPYCWHQPLCLLNFEPIASVPPQDWQDHAPKEKPLAMPKRDFALAKSLIRWVLTCAQDEIEQGVRPLLPQPPPPVFCGATSAIPMPPPASCRSGEQQLPLF